MNKHILCWFILVTLFFSREINSRPISYQGGWTIMQKNDFNRHSFHSHFSPSINYSIGYRVEYWRKKEWIFHGLQLNYLLKRVNKPNSQANLYFKNALGFALSDYKNFDNNIEPNIFSGVAFDWENRQFFFNYENRINYNYTIDRFLVQKTRIGFAPYIGKYGDLHTWFMFQIDHMPNSSDNLVFTPFVRIFKGDYLAEIGLSYHNDFMFNFIKRF